MKAEEWYAEGGLNNDVAEIAHRRAIQLDAMKEGMRRAAKVKLPVFQLPTGYTGNRYIHGVHFESGNAHGVAETRQAILTAAEQLTEKDL